MTKVLATPLDVTQLAQLSRTDDLIFHLLLVPCGLILAGYGWRTARRGSLTLHRPEIKLQGAKAVFAGYVLMALGFIGSAASLFQLLG